ncbi:MAG: response regulator [Rhizobacter sp.]
MSHNRMEGDSRPVLVVEDSDDDFDTVVEAATRAGVGNRLIRAADAEIARSLLAREAAGSFSFILLDYNLPCLDGLAFLEILRRDPVLAALPVVIYTTSVNPRDRDAFLRTGANAFHLKSVQHADSLRTLESIFDHWLTRAAPAPGGPRA